MVLSELAAQVLPCPPRSRPAHPQGLAPAASGRSALHCPHPGGLKARPGCWGLWDGRPVTGDRNRVQASVCSLHSVYCACSPQPRGAGRRVPAHCAPGRAAAPRGGGRTAGPSGSRGPLWPRAPPAGEQPPVRASPGAALVLSRVLTSPSTGAVFFSIFLTLASGAGPSPSFPGMVLGRLWPWSPSPAVAQPVRLVPSLWQQDPLLDTARGGGRDSLRTGSAAGRAGKPGVGGEPSGVQVGALKTVLTLFVSSLFIRCLLSCGALVNFLLKTPSFLSCAKTNKEKAWAPCPSWAAAPGGRAGGGWGPGRVSVGLDLSHRALPPLPPSTMWRFKNEASQEACRFGPKRSRVNSTPPSKPHSSIPSPSGRAHLLGILGDSAALNSHPWTGSSDSTGRRRRLEGPRGSWQPQPGPKALPMAAGFHVWAGEHCRGPWGFPALKGVEIKPEFTVSSQRGDNINKYIK